MIGFFEFLQVFCMEIVNRFDYVSQMKCCFILQTLYNLYSPYLICLRDRYNNSKDSEAESKTVLDLQLQLQLKQLNGLLCMEPTTLPPLLIRLAFYVGGVPVRRSAAAAAALAAAAVNGDWSIGATIRWQACQRKTKWQRQQ